MNKQRIAILIVSLIGALATFMPWASIPVFGSINGTHSPIGKVSLVLFIIPMIMCFLGNLTNEFKKTSIYIILTTSIFVFLLDLIQLVSHNLKNQNNTPLDQLLAEVVSIGFGLYIAIIAGAMLPIFLFLLKSKQQPIPKKKSSIKKRDIKFAQKKTKVVDEPKAKFNNHDHIKAKKSADNTITELKKIREQKKEFDPSDHNRFMPK